MSSLLGVSAYAILGFWISQILALAAFAICCIARFERHGEPPDEPTDIPVEDAEDTEVPWRHLNLIDRDKLLRAPAVRFTRFISLLLTGIVLFLTLPICLWFVFASNRRPA